MSSVDKGKVGLLVAALRSGLYPKGYGKLHRAAAGFQKEGWCCLGVACDVAARSGLELSRDTDHILHYERFDGSDSYLPQKVQEWFGFDNHSPRLKTPGGMKDAASVNDTGYSDPATGSQVEVSLSEIADMFENTYLKDEAPAQE
jgi:hypothetical protein